VKLAALILFVAFTACAADRYVRTDGNDGNDGTADTSGSAWLTVNYGVSQLSSGDTLHVAAGRYTGDVTMNKSGVTITGPTNAWLDGQILWTGNSSTLDGVRFGVTNRTRGQPTPTSDGVPYGHIELTSASSNRIVNCYVDSGATVGWRTNAGSGSAVYWDSSGCNYNVCSNNCIEGINWTKGIFQVSGRGNIFVSNTITRTYDCDTFYLNGWDHIIEGNSVSSNVIVDAENAVESQHSDVFQFTAGVDTSNVVMRANFCHDSECQLGFSSQDTGVSVHHVYWYNNLFWNITSYLRVSVPSAFLWNNVFHRVNYESVTITTPLDIGGADPLYDATGLDIRNNVFIWDGSAAWPWSVEGGAGTNGFTHANNYFGSEAYAAKSVTETGMVNGGDPLFVSATDFRLQASSSLIGVATNLNAFFTTDAAGTTRGTVWDIGAYEYEAAPAPSGSTNTFGAVNIIGTLTIGP
jgi:hypothetical protein